MIAMTTTATRRAPVNPLAGAVHSTIGFGVSQSGRFLRTLLDLGFNEDENGNRVFDGLDPEIASYRISLNIRFAQPTRLAGTQHTEKQFPGPGVPHHLGRHARSLLRTSADRTPGPLPEEPHLSQGVQHRQQHRILAGRDVGHDGGFRW